MTWRRATRLSRHALVALAAAAVGAVPTSAASTPLSSAPQPPQAGSLGLRLVDAPAIARNDPRAQIYIVDHLAPGTVINRQIEVSNTTASTAHIILYPSAASIDKGSFLGASGHTPNDLSTWTSVFPGASDVPAGGRVVSTVTIAVPTDAAPGEQYGVVWAETRSAPTASGGVIQVSRVGIRLYLSIGPGGPPAANLTIDSLTAKRSPDGRPLVVAAVHNSGGRALDLNGSLQLSAGPGGLSAGPFLATLGVTLAIGDTEPVIIALDKRLPAGPWDVQITLRSGLLERSAHATITFPAAGASASINTTTARHGWVPPLSAHLAVDFILVGLAVLIVLVVRRQSRRAGRPRAV